MSWVKLALERLQNHEHALVRPSGHSMTGVINHRDEVILAPIDPSRLEVGDAVLVRVAGQVYLHLIKAIDAPRQRVLIGNNRGRANGWTSFSKVFGVAVQIADRMTAAAKRVEAEISSPEVEPRSTK